MERIREFQKRSKFSAADIAREIGCSRPAVSAWINGESSPGLDLAVGLARVLGCTLNELASVEDSRVELTSDDKLVIEAFHALKITAYQAMKRMEIEPEVIYYGTTTHPPIEPKHSRTPRHGSA